MAWKKTPQQQHIWVRRRKGICWFVSGNGYLIEANRVHNLSGYLPDSIKLVRRWKEFWECPEGTKKAPKHHFVTITPLPGAQGQGWGMQSNIPERSSSTLQRRLECKPPRIRRGSYRSVMQKRSKQDQCGLKEGKVRRKACRQSTERLKSKKEGNWKLTNLFSGHETEGIFHKSLEVDGVVCLVEI